LILADTGQALGSLLLVVSLASGRFEVWHLYLVALVQGSFSIIQQPAEDAVTTILVPDERRDRANAIRQMAFPLAGVVAPALAGLFFVWIGVTGIILIDLASFLVALVAVTVVHIPRPPASAEGRAAQGHWLREMLSGFRYFGARRVLLAYVLYMTLINFLLNGPLELAIPYLILKTGDEKLAGSLLGLASLGAFIGASIVAVRSRTRNRVLVMFGGMLLCGLMFLVYGTASTAWVLGASILVLMIPLPMGSALWISLLQTKTPPDMQGRIFASLAQLAFLGSTTSFLLTGWLVDHWLEPAVGRPGWSAWAPLVGSEPGAGMGLLLVFTGLIILAATLFMLASSTVRQIEGTLPDYAAAEAEPEPGAGG
jgi:MFS family permease